MLKIKLKENKKLLNEIKLDDVLATISVDNKKFRKRLVTVFADTLEDIPSVRAALIAKAKQPPDTPEKRANFQKSVDTFKNALVKSVPEDIEEAQKGAAANWLKKYYLSSASVLNRFVYNDGSGQWRNPEFWTMTAKNVLEKFFQAQAFIPEDYSKDINSYSDLDSIRDAAEAGEKLRRAHLEKKKYMNPEEGMEVLYNGDDWTIIIPTNKGAACQLGKGTSWCTAAPGLDYYEQYHKEDDPLIVFINKNNPKQRYQFHFGTNQFMNTHDVPVSEKIFNALASLLERVRPGLITQLTSTEVDVQDGSFIMKTVNENDEKSIRYLWRKHGPHGTGKRHNIKGPAQVAFDPDLQSARESWYINGILIGRIRVTQDISYGQNYEITDVQNIFAVYLGNSNKVEESRVNLGTDDWEDVFSAQELQERIHFLPEYKKWSDYLTKEAQRVYELQKNEPEELDERLEENLKLLSEVSLEDVLTNIRTSKKFKKKVVHALSQEMKVFSQNAKEEFPEATDEDIQKSREHILEVGLERIEKVIKSSIPRDIEEAQKGAAANWVRSIFLTSPKDVVTVVRGERGAMIVHDFYKYNLSNRIESFFQMQRFIPEEYPKDIMKYDTFEQLKNAVNAARPAYEEYQEKKSYLDAEEGTEVVYDGPEWTILIPHNKGAACHWGKGTNWCTAAPGLDYYEQYHSEKEPLFIFIDKNDPENKYQFHYGTEQFMNSYDERVDQETFVKLHTLLANEAKLDDEIKERVTSYVIVNELDDSLSYKREVLEGDYYSLKYVDDDGDLHLVGAPAKWWFQMEISDKDELVLMPRDISWYYHGKTFASLKYDLRGIDEYVNLQVTTSEFHGASSGVWSHKKHDKIKVPVGVIPRNPESVKRYAENFMKELPNMIPEVWNMLQEHTYKMMRRRARKNHK